MELRWLVDATGNKTLQYRDQGNNGIYGPGSNFYDTGWVDVPEVVDDNVETRNTANSTDTSQLPNGCREKLRLEGRTYPRSGCDVCGTGGIKGCPYQKIET